MNPVVVVVIVIICIAVCCLCCYIGAKNQVGDDYYNDEVIVEETVTHYDDGPKMAEPTYYPPGTNPPGTAMTNDGHLFTYMTNNPYPDDTATCDNCQQVI